MRWLLIGLVACGSSSARPPAVGNTPSPSKVLSIAVGPLHACAVMVDGGVRCWVYNEFGEVNATKQPPAVRVPTTVPGVANIVSLRLADRMTDAIRKDGSVVGWGHRSTSSGCRSRRRACSWTKTSRCYVT